MGRRCDHDLMCAYNISGGRINFFYVKTVYIEIYECMNTSLDITSRLLTSARWLLVMKGKRRNSTSNMIFKQAKKKRRRIFFSSLANSQNEMTIWWGFLLPLSRTHTHTYIHTHIHTESLFSRWLLRYIYISLMDISQSINPIAIIAMDW